MTSVPEPREPVSSARVTTLPLDLITPGAFQARRHFTDSALDELAASIAESGVIQPIVVRGNHHLGYTLLAGERRWRAAARAGLQQLPAIIRNDLNDDQAAILGLVENLQRESLGVIDTARGLQSLCDSHGLTHDAAAARIGKSRVYVTNYLRILNLTKPVRALLDEGSLTLGHAKALAGLARTDQAVIARQAASRRLSVRALERLIQEQSQRSPAATTSTADVDLAALERNLSAHLGNNVRVHYAADRRRGQLRIDFHGLDEFEGLLNRLGFRTEDADDYSLIDGVYNGDS